MKSRCKSDTNDRGKQLSGCWIRAERRLAIYLRDSFECQCCGRDLRGCRPEEMGLDHLRPRSQRGTNAESNLATICRSCNSSRGAKPWTQYYPAGAIERVRSLRYRKLNIALAKAIIAGKSTINESIR